MDPPNQRALLRIPEVKGTAGSVAFALDEVNLDFQTLGPAPNNPDEVEVLIAASRKEKVEDYDNLFTTFFSDADY